MGFRSDFFVLGIILMFSATCYVYVQGGVMNRNTDNGGAPGLLKNKMDIGSRIGGSSDSKDGSDNLEHQCCYHHPISQLDSKFTELFFEKQQSRPGPVWTGREMAEWRAIRSQWFSDNATVDACEAEWHKVVLKKARGHHLRAHMDFLLDKPSETPFRYIEDTPSLPRILYLGDPVSVATCVEAQNLYGGALPEHRKLANIHTAPSDSGKFKDYAKHLNKWLGSCPWDLIQFNIGSSFLSKGDVDLSEYERNLKQIISRLQDHSPSATVVFALTTPSPLDSPATASESHEGCPHHNMLGKAGTIPSLNQVARKVAEEMKIEVNDRFDAIHPSLRRFQRPCNANFKPDGYTFLAQHDWKAVSSLLSDILQPGVSSNNAGTWNDVAEKLCPAGIPNLNMSKLVFELARDQMGIDQEEFQAVQKSVRGFVRDHPDVDLAQRFFDGPFQDATVFTSDKTNESIVYVPIWKGGNISIRRWMRRTFGDIESGELFDSDLGEFFRNAHGRACIVTAIRDPVTHFLSGYNEIETRRNNLTPRNQEQLTKYYSMPFGTAEERVSRFEQFVYDLLLEDSRAWKVSVMKHVFSMSKVLTLLRQLNANLSAYLPSLNELGVAFPAMVDRHCKSVVSHHQEEMEMVAVPASNHMSSEDEEGFYEAAKDVWAQGGPVAEALCILHSVDYACWKDLIDGIPPLCRTVFESSNFVERVLSF